MSESPKTTRREIVTMLGHLGALALLPNCVGDDADLPAAPGTGAGGSGGAGAGGAGGAAEGGGAGAPGASGSGGSSPDVPWATGGAAVLLSKEYGNPFAAGTGAICTLYEKSTGGPCHTTSDKLVRKDITEGYPGVPMRLELLIVDVSCQPVPGATVEIWHTDTRGIYSGDTDGNQDDFCTTGEAKAKAALWYRGIQTAGTDGRVTFDSNFPGWYGGRANHIHFRVTVGAVTYLTSQLFFDEALNQEIYNSQPNYQPTASPTYQGNAGDGVIASAGLSLPEVVVATAKQSDGAMLAWKAIAIGS